MKVYKFSESFNNADDRNKAKGNKLYTTSKFKL